MTLKRISTTNLALSIKGLVLLCLLTLAPPAGFLQLQAQTSATAPLILRGDSVDSILALLEKLTGRSVIRPQGLPATLFNFTSQKPLTVEERIVAIESLLALNGIAVIPQGELFLKVVLPGGCLAQGGCRECADDGQGEQRAGDHRDTIASHELAQAIAERRRSGADGLVLAMAPKILEERGH